ncbi:MAG: hypothetical protein FJ144_18185 [Deltaproteobacteria bacterium]|nr:hypothetical protein [Deltaproteobacteria bacterium]
MRAARAAAAWILVSTTVASAHLRPVGGSLVELVGAADAIVLAEAVAATVDRRDPVAGTVAETRFRTVEKIAGAESGETFTVSAGVPPLRYAPGQRAFVLLERSAGGWQATQPAGMGLVLSSADTPAESVSILAALFDATRAEEPRADDLAPILRRAARAPHPKIRLMAALDLAELVHHDRLVVTEKAATRALLDDPDLDRAARTPLAAAFARAEPPEAGKSSDEDGSTQ